jgi:DNA-binding Lrp family transcriptional regulator
MVPDTMIFDTRRIQAQDVRLWCVLAYNARFRGSCDSTDRQLADKLGVSVPSVQRSLLRLTKAGYIDRIPAEQGRRITLNPEGDGAAMPPIQVAR